MGRETELRRLFESVALQEYPSVRVILVDMSGSRAVAALVAEFGSLEILHRTSSPVGVSRARNHGIGDVEADVVSLTDDDCWYPERLLQSVGRRFSSDPGLAGLSVRQLDESLRPSNGRWARRPGIITKSNVWGRAVSSGMFFRSEAITAAGAFDETLGPGSGCWEAGEETDLLIRVVETGRRVHYEPSLHVHHPDPLGVGTDRSAAYSLERWGAYARATGHLMRKHRFPPHAVAYRCCRPLVGSAVAALQGDFTRSRIRLTVATGRAAGWARSQPGKSGR